MSARAQPRISRESIVAANAAVLFLPYFAIAPAFRAPANLLWLRLNVSILGLLGVGMALSIIGRGTDLSIGTGSIGGIPSPVILFV